jgi:uncharacterized protein YdaL
VTHEKLSYLITRYIILQRGKQQLPDGLFAKIATSKGIIVALDYKKHQ